MREPQRDEYKKHPLYVQKMKDALNSLQPDFPSELLPADFKEWTLAALMQRSYPACNIPLIVYRTFIHSDVIDWGFGEIKCAADMVFESRPEAMVKCPVCNGLRQGACINCSPSGISGVHSYMYAHLHKLEEVGKMIMWFDEFMKPLEEQALDETIAEVKEQNAKAQAKKMIVS